MLKKKCNVVFLMEDNTETKNFEHPTKNICHTCNGVLFKHNVYFSLKTVIKNWIFCMAVTIYKCTPTLTPQMSVWYPLCTVQSCTIAYSLSLSSSYRHLPSDLIFYNGNIFEKSNNHSSGFKLDLIFKDFQI